MKSYVVEMSPILIAQAHGAEATSATPLQVVPGTPQETTTHTTTTAPATPGDEAHGGGGAHHVSAWVFFGFSMVAFFTLLILSVLGMRRMRLVPRGLQNMLEMLLESLYGVPEMVMGPRGRGYAPFVATFFLYILAMNILGLIPFFKPATANLSITLGMAIVAFVAVQYFGFKTHGIKYLAHFLGPVPAMAFLILPLELLSEFIRIASLSIRLYGNLYGEEQVITALASNLTPFSAVIMLPLQVLASILQAFVFTLLVTVYISLATASHDSHEESGEAHAH